MPLKILCGLQPQLKKVHFVNIKEHRSIIIPQL